MSPLHRSRDGLTSLLVSVVALGLAGCATIGGTRQYTSFDSTHRGVEVRDAAEPDKPLGVTPFFAETRRAANHEYLLRHEDGTEVRLRAGCDYRWAASLLANAPLGAAAVVNPWAGVGLLAAGNVTDLVTGSAFDCARVRIDNSLSQIATQKHCPRLLVLPPVHADPKASARLAALYKAALQKRGGCETLVEEAAARELLLRMEVDNDATLDVRRADPDRLGELGARTGASAVVELRSDVIDTDRLLVFPVRHDLHTREQDPETPFEVSLKEEPTLFPSPLKKAALASLNVLPNSIAFAVAGKSLGFQPVGGGTVRDEAIPSDVPAALANWTVEWVEPPQKHGQWDFVGTLGPKVNFGYSSRQLTLTPDGGTPVTDNVRVLHTLGLLAAKGNFYTPLGVFGLQLGAGGGGAFAWGAGVPAEQVAVGGGWFALAHADYTIFPLRTLFVSLAYDQLASLGGPHLTTPSWSLSGLQMGSVTVGYFLPELKGWASNLF